MMGQVTMAFSENPRAFRKNDYGLENALAKFVRNKFPDKTIPYTAHYFGLSESEAAKVVYGTASKNTLNKLLHHKNGGAKLYINLVLDVTDTKLEQYIIQQAREAADEAAKWEAEEHRLAILHASLSKRHCLDGRADQQARPGRSDDEGLGAREDGAAVEPKTFAPRRRT